MKKLVSILCVFVMLMTVTYPVTAAKKDTKAPMITKTSPIDFGSDIMIESSIVIRFSEAIKKGKNFTKISIKEAETKSISYTYVVEDNLLIITPKADLKYDTSYKVTIPGSAVTDKAGNNLKEAYSFHFISEKNPSKVGTDAKIEDTQYVLEIGVVLKEELTDAKLAYFSQLLEKFGIEATYVNMYKPADKKKWSKAVGQIN